MSKIIKSILTRVLNEELVNQMMWKKQDEERGLDSSVMVRDNVIAEIKKFMSDNDIPVLP